MKHIYLVRHGETDCNKRLIHQRADTPLNETGKEQMHTLAEALRAIPATKLLSSDLPRAVESATIISETLGLKVETSDLFEEVRRPSVLFGRHYFGTTTLRVGISILYHLNNRTWHYSDEENIYDIRERVVKAVDHLKELGQTHEHVIVVAHAFIINLFIKYMCEVGRVRRRDYLASLVAAKRLVNGSISTVTFNDDHNPNTCDWICLKVNDTSYIKT